MKKLLLAVLFAVFAMPAFAGIDEGIDKGMTHVFIMGGVAFPATQFEVGNTNYDFAGKGFTYGAQMMYYLAPVFGMGVEFNGTSYGEQTTRGISFKANKYSYMLAGKVNFMAEQKTRVYIPFGAGMATFKSEVDGDSETASKPAVYAGVGVESDLNDIFLIGFEVRYNYFWIDKERMGVDNGALSDLGALLKIGIKF